MLDGGVSENRLNPIVPNGFADHYPVLKWLLIIGNMNPTFSDKPMVFLGTIPWCSGFKSVVHAWVP